MLGLHRTAERDVAMSAYYFYVMRHHRQRKVFDHRAADLTGQLQTRGLRLAVSRDKWLSPDWQASCRKDSWPLIFVKDFQ
jgi:hypothetical protein